ncbi:MAG: hypothetical protein M3Q71_16705 [Chloroflexota bacterium]|nr:hypothetical protein [Chloroflexota bacterium]
MSSPDDHDDERTDPLTDQEAEFLEAYRELDESGQAWLTWAVQALRGRQPPRAVSLAAGTLVGGLWRLCRQSPGHACCRFVVLLL